MDLNNQINDYNLKIEEKDNTITEMNTTLNTITEEVNSLKEYRLGIETQQKEAVIAQYVSKLNDDVLDSYKEKFSEYTAEELDMHLAYELKKINSSVFTSNAPVYIPKDNQNPTGIAAVLSKYRK